MRRIDSGSSPSTSRRNSPAPSASVRLSRIRSTASSPYMLGMTDTRKSTGRLRTDTLKRPSWGMRVSEMSSSDITLIREMTSCAMARPCTRPTELSTPSMRYRISSPAGSLSR